MQFAFTKQNAQHETQVKFTGIFAAELLLALSKKPLIK